YHLRYPLSDGSGELHLATTRPETLLGDTAVAVHPDDERYKAFVGKTVRLPLCNRDIPVIADTYVEPDFGTGVVKITPAHDPNDFEVGLRHSLPMLNVMNEDGTMNEEAGTYAGLTVAECRKAVVAALKEQGYLLKIEPLAHNVGSCYRCHTVIEPRVSEQWFVKMAPLAEPALDSLRAGKPAVVPQRFEKVCGHWLENIRDWCISRQLWWGHRIPAWYCDTCGEMTVARTAPDKCPHCGGTLRQDEDTLDTWFSSALWPFSTLGWPDETPELDYFYPTSTLVTGYDILFFWVMRMLFSGIEYTGKAPFDTVFFHGLVRDGQGRKMSKSLDNGIDPLDVIDQYGADALRFMLTAGNSQGNDMRFSTEKVEAARNFANKLWNAARFIDMNVEGHDVPLTLPATLTVEDKWLLSGYNALVAAATDNLEHFELGLALTKVYDFTWDTFCDWYIELCKPRLQAGDGAARQVLCFVMRGVLSLLHPFMPFVTEEIFQALPHAGEALMVSPWPVADDALNFPAEAREFARVTEAIRAVRARRADMNVPPSRRAQLYIETAFEKTFADSAVFFERLAGASGVQVGAAFDVPNAVSVVTADATIKIPLADLVDMAEERARLQKERDGAQKQLDGVLARLNNPEFTGKAPVAVVAGAQDNAAKLKEKLAGLDKMLEGMKG
ncbi:MAG: valine--tRNA ligase, partial [Oscillospiraceae bacterium]|nr:valine--tRNA ligase [Oscillospiraceae bacterium]